MHKKAEQKNRNRADQIQNEEGRDKRKRGIERKRENVERTENCRTDRTHWGGNGTAKNCRATDKQDRKNGQTGGQTDGQTIRDVVVSLGRSFIRSFGCLVAWTLSRSSLRRIQHLG